VNESFSRRERLACGVSPEISTTVFFVDPLRSFTLSPPPRAGAGNKETMKKKTMKSTLEIGTLQW
jgi:hypothetical protein